MHGFYAAMGGLAIQTPTDLPESERYSPSEANELYFVTRGGIQLLLKESGTGREEVPNISEEEIRSKSRANGVAKSLVCIQTLWFITQCITRCKLNRQNFQPAVPIVMLTDTRALAQHIPISLLELNTFGHAVCALMIYFLWWDKPFDVDYPTIIASPTLHQYLALCCMQIYASVTIKTSYVQDRAETEDRQSYLTVSCKATTPRP